MTPATLPLNIVRGLTLGPIVINCFGDVANTQPVPLNGWKAYAQVRKCPGGDLLLDLTPQVSQATTGATVGQITLTEPKEVTAALSCVGNFFWDLVLETPSGVRMGPYIEGPCPVSSIITQPA